MASTSEKCILRGNKKKASNFIPSVCDSIIDDDRLWKANHETNVMQIGQHFSHNDCKHEIF